MKYTAVHIPGFESAADARNFVKDAVRFLPASGIEVWLVDPPGLYISGESLSAYDIDALKRERSDISPIPGGEPPPDIVKIELLYGGLY